MSPGRLHRHLYLYPSRGASPLIPCETLLHLPGTGILFLAFLRAYFVQPLIDPLQVVGPLLPRRLQDDCR
jgi:hypothetical protein